jgi:replicative DNA helicase
MTDRIPPQCLEIERAIIASFLVNHETFLKYGSQIKPVDFYNSDHRVIFSYMLETTITDMVLISDKFPNRSLIIVDMVATCSTSENLEYYIKELKDRSYRRQQITAMQLAQEQLYTDFDTSALIIAENTMFELNACEQQINKPQSISEIMPAMFEQLGTIAKGEGVKTGLNDIDEIMGTFFPGEFILLAGRPSMGKTTLGNQIARRAARDGYPALIFSLETLKNVMCARIVFSETEKSLGLALKGNMREIAAMTALCGPASELPIFLDDSPDITVGHIQNVTENYVKRYGVKLVMIDHLGLVKTKGGRSRNEEVSEISTGLKRIGLRYEVPILALNQLSRAVEMRNPPIPILSDLRDSGSLEQDADKVIFIYREEYYNRKSEKKGIAEIIVAKNKNNAVGHREVVFDKETMNFKNLRKENDAEARTEFLPVS